MTAVVFIVLLVAGAFLFDAGIYAIGGTSIYVIFYALTLTTACSGAVLSGKWRQIAAAVVLILNWTASHHSWTTADPVVATVILDLITATYFVFVGARRFELILGILYLLSVVAGVATFFGMIPGSVDRPFLYIAWSHPDILAIIGHGANVILGMGSGDLGAGRRRYMEVKSYIVFGGQRFGAIHNNRKKMASDSTKKASEVNVR